MTDRVWNSLPDTPRKPFGSALRNAPDSIISPMLITEPTKQITRRDLRRAMARFDSLTKGSVE